MCKLTKGAHSPAPFLPAIHASTSERFDRCQYFIGNLKTKLHRSVDPIETTSFTVEFSYSSSPGYDVASAILYCIQLPWTRVPGRKISKFRRVSPLFLLENSANRCKHRATHPSSLVPSVRTTVTKLALKNWAPQQKKISPPQWIPQNKQENRYWCSSAAGTSGHETQPFGKWPLG